MKLNHQSEKYSKNINQSDRQSDILKIIAVLICKQQLKQLEQGILPPKEQKYYNLETTFQKNVYYLTTFQIPVAVTLIEDC